MRDYVIWSFEHEAWWGPNRCGYTDHLNEAGRYTAEEAGDIVTASVWLDEVAMLETVLERFGGQPPQFHPFRGERIA